MEKLIGKQAIGTKHDMTFKRPYQDDFPRGWKTYGIITKFDPKTRKYLIEGQNCIFNETGEFNIEGTGNWFSRSQIELEKFED